MQQFLLKAILQTSKSKQRTFEEFFAKILYKTKITGTENDNT